MQDKSQKAESLKLSINMLNLRVMTPYFEEKYSNYLENRYTGKNLPSWMNLKCPSSK